MSSKTINLQLLPEEVLFEEVQEESLSVIDFTEPEPPYFPEDRNQALYQYLIGKKAQAFKTLSRVTYKELQYLFDILNLQNNISIIRKLVSFLLESADVSKIFKDDTGFQLLTDSIDKDNEILHKSAHLYSMSLYDLGRKEDALKIFQKLGEPASCYITAKFLGMHNDSELLDKLYCTTKSQYFLSFHGSVLYKNGDKDAAFQLFDQLNQERPLIIVRKLLFENKDQENIPKINEKIAKFKNTKTLIENDTNLEPFARCQAAAYGLMLYDKNKKSDALDIFRKIDDTQSVLMIGRRLLEANDDTSIEIILDTELYKAFQYCMEYVNGDDFEAYQCMYEDLEKEIPLMVASQFLVDRNVIKQANGIASKLDPFGCQYIEGDQSTAYYARYIYQKGHVIDAMKFFYNGKFPSRGLSFLLAMNDIENAMELTTHCWQEELPVCGMKFYTKGLKDFALQLFKSCSSDQCISAVASFLLRVKDFESIQDLYKRTGNEFYILRLAQNYYNCGDIEKAYQIFDTLLNEEAIFKASQFLLSKSKIDDSILLIKKTTDQKKIESFVELLYRNNKHRKAIKLFNQLDEDDVLFSAARFLLYQNNFEQSRLLYQSIRDQKMLFEYGKLLYKQQLPDIGWQVFIHLESDKYLNKAAKEMFPMDPLKSIKLYKHIKDEKYKVKYAKFLYSQSKIEESMKIFNKITNDSVMDIIVAYLCFENDLSNAEIIADKMTDFEGPGIARYAVRIYDTDKEKALEIFSKIQRHDYLYYYEITPLSFLVQHGEYELAHSIFLRCQSNQEMANYLFELYKIPGKKEEAFQLFLNDYSTNQEIAKRLADHLSKLKDTSDVENYKIVRDKITDQKLIFQHGLILLNQKDKDGCVEMFKKIESKEFGCKATFLLYQSRMNELADEFNAKFPSGQRLFGQGKSFYNVRKYEESWDCFNKIEEQEFILSAATFMFEKNEFDKAVTLFKRYNGSIESKLCFKLAKEFHKKEMFEEAHFYYNMSNCPQARAILSRCFRDKTVGAYKKPKSIQQVIFAPKRKDDDSGSGSGNAQLSPLELEEEEKKKKRAKRMESVEKITSGASETYNLFSIIYSFLPVVLSLIRLIQSCSITVSESNIHFVEEFLGLFDWSTRLLNIIAFDWIRIEELTNSQSLLILTFLCTFLLSLFSIGLSSGYKALLACLLNSIFFIPIGVGLDYLPSNLGIGLFVGFIALYVIVTTYVMCKVKNTIPRYLLCYFLPKEINEAKIRTYQDIQGNKHFGWFSDTYHLTRNVYLNTNLCLLIPIIIFILISYGVLKTNPLFYVIIVCCALVYVISLILQLFLKKRIYTFMQIIGTGMTYFSVIVGQIMLLPFMDMLTNTGLETPPKTIIVFVVVFSVVVPFVNIIISCAYVQRMKKTQNPLFIRVWLNSSFSPASSLCCDLKLRCCMWPVLDFAYHILYAISNAYVDPILNLALAALIILLTLVFQPYCMISENVLYLSEPVVILILNALIIHNSSKSIAITLSIGYIIIGIALIPVVFSILFYWLYEKQKDHEFELVIHEINHPKSFCFSCSPGEPPVDENGVFTPFSTEEINKKIFHRKRNELYHEVFRNEQNAAESVLTNTWNPDCIPDVKLISKKFDPKTLEIGDLFNRIIVGPGMIFTAAAICHLIRYT